MANVSNDGFLVASAEEARAILAQLKKDIASNPALAQRYNLSPGHVLGERGLSIPIQEQHHRERMAAMCQVGTGCLCTNCLAGAPLGTVTLSA
jgi:hypothetical protein